MDNAVVSTNIPAIICTLYHTFIKKHFLNLLRRTGPLCHLVIYIYGTKSGVMLELKPYLQIIEPKSTVHTIVPLI
jgi:hypothetical protein